MFHSVFRSIAGSALLALAAAPSAAVTLSTLPAQPVEQTPFTLVIGGNGGCATLEEVRIERSLNLVRVFLHHCPPPPQPFLLEVPIPPLAQGEWLIQVLSGNQPLAPSLTVNVEPRPIGLALDPPSPQPGTPFTVLLTGSGSCTKASTPVQDGNLLTFAYEDDCNNEFVPPPEPFVIPLPMDPLPAGDYVVQVIDRDGRTLASRRFAISNASACQPSETALCLLQGRYRVEATWRTATAQDTAKAHPESANFGAFSLTEADHLELFVGLLDACDSPTHTVWVSTNGLTDAEVEITVTEMATAEVRRYDNPFGMRFATVWDPMAFVCP